MRVIHVTPWYFDPVSVVGGGERYTQELAAAMARRVPTEVWTFGSSDRTIDYKGVTLRVHAARRSPRAANDFLAWAAVHAARVADVVHVHQPHTMTGNLAVLGAWLRRRACAVTDLGGVTPCPSRRLGLSRWVDLFLPISEYASRVHDEDSHKVRVIGAGVDTERFRPPAAAGERREVLFVGRILPHKGIDYLIEGLPDGVKLRIAGEAYSAEYLTFLKGLTRGKDVEFQHGVSDDELVRLYQDALVTVLPTVTTDRWGATNARAQLSALTVLESFACATPAIASAVEAVPEIVEDGRTGLLVPPNNARALAKAIQAFVDDPSLADRMGRAARRATEERFTWDAVTERALAAYCSVDGGAL